MDVPQPTLEASSDTPGDASGSPLRDAARRLAEIGRASDPPLDGAPLGAVVLASLVAALLPPVRRAAWIAARVAADEEAGAVLLRGRVATAEHRDARGRPAWRTAEATLMAALAVTVGTRTAGQLEELLDSGVPGALEAAGIADDDRPEALALLAAADVLDDPAPAPDPADAAAGPSSPPAPDPDVDPDVVVVLELVEVVARDGAPAVSLRLGAGERVAVLVDGADDVDGVLDAVQGGAAPVSGVVRVADADARGGGPGRPASVARLGDLAIPDRTTPLELLREYDAAGVDETLDAVGLTADATTPAGDLTSGARRRLEIARALAGGATVLIAGPDTPGTHLAGRGSTDDAGDAEVRALASALRRAAERGIAILLLASDRDTAELLADRVLPVGAGDTGAVPAVDPGAVDADAPDADAPDADAPDADVPDADAGAPGDPGDDGGSRLLLLNLALRGLSRDAAAEAVREQTGTTPAPALLEEVFDRVERIEEPPSTDADGSTS